jgi:hypothetical protein
MTHDIFAIEIQNVQINLLANSLLERIIITY